MTVYSVDKLISETRRLAAEYRRATGDSLPVTAEIARHDVARLLGFELVPVSGEGGYDAVGSGRWEGLRVQIKGRVLFDEGKASPRLGQFKLGQEWDVVMLLLLDPDYEPLEIHAVARDELEDEVQDKGGRSRKGALSVAKFKIIGELVWTREHGLEDDGYWDNSVSL